VEFVRFMADHLARPRTRAVPDAGHFGPRTHPETVARELAGFFGEVRQAA
jgi:pimeloyl-ACP methyl ester carboxylesterase